MPNTIGTSAASAIQAIRSPTLGTDLASGTKAITRSAILGTITPSSSSGHAAAAATTAERMVCSLCEVWPKSAITAHPKMALSAFPADLLR